MPDTPHVRRTRRGTYHVIAQCRGCDWSDDDYRRARDRARSHCRATGHDVTVDVGLSFRYTQEAPDA